MRSAFFVMAAGAAVIACTSTAPGASTAPTSPTASPIATTAQPTATAAVAPGATPEGRMVDIGERSLYLECAGSGSPTVILEAGLTGDHRTWEKVVPDLQGSAMVCAYDRANIAPSDPAPGPRTAEDIVEDLHALLAAEAIAPPYVLVGFSFGGLATQLYASTYPDEVAGIVLVESNHPEEAAQFEEHLTPEQIAEDRAFVLDNPELVDPYASFDEVQAAGPVPEVPLVVVTAGISEGWPPDWDAELFDRLRSEQQADLATLVPGGQQVFAENSTHDIPSQQPEVIVDAVSTVLAELP